MSLCPSCAQADVGHNPSGFCDACTVDRAAANYSESDRARAAACSVLWGKPSAKATDARLAALRQARHKFEVKIRPTRPVASDVDPWSLGADALSRCKRLMQSFPASRSELEEVCETVRRLCWGPDDSESWTVQPRHHRHREIPGQMFWDFAEAQVAA
jgi:hypothetical protein